MLIPPTPPGRGGMESATQAAGRFWCVPVLPGTELVRSPMAKSFLKYSWVQKGESEELNLREFVFHLLRTT